MAAFVLTAVFAFGQHGHGVGHRQHGSKPYESNLRFSHAAHVAKGMVCEQCHHFVPDAARPGRDLQVRQVHDACVRCHRRELTSRLGRGSALKLSPDASGWVPLPNTSNAAALASMAAAAERSRHPEGDCGLCHLDHPPGPAVRTRERLRDGLAFTHRSHSAHKVNCLDCHATVPDWDNLEGSRVDRAMERCLRCHDNVTARKNCRVCHPTTIPRPADHPREFVRKHGTAWRSQPGRCRMCHEDSSCVDCHSRRPRDHTVGFIRRRHGITAQANPDKCAACHGPPPGDVCGRCHHDRR